MSVTDRGASVDVVVATVQQQIRHLSNVFRGRAFWCNSLRLSPQAITSWFAAPRNATHTPTRLAGLLLLGLTLGNVLAAVSPAPPRDPALDLYGPPSDADDDADDADTNCGDDADDGSSGASPVRASPWPARMYNPTGGLRVRAAAALLVALSEVAEHTDKHFNSAHAKHISSSSSSSSSAAAPVDPESSTSDVAAAAAAAGATAADPTAAPVASCFLFSAPAQVFTPSAPAVSPQSLPGATPAADTLLSHSEATASTSASGSRIGGARGGAVWVSTAPATNAPPAPLAAVPSSTALAFLSSYVPLLIAPLFTAPAQTLTAPALRPLQAPPAPAATAAATFSSSASAAAAAAGTGAGVGVNAGADADAEADADGVTVVASAARAGSSLKAAALAWLRTPAHSHYAWVDASSAAAALPLPRPLTAAFASAAASTVTADSTAAAAGAGAGAVAAVPGGVDVISLIVGVLTVAEQAVALLSLASAASSDSSSSAAVSTAAEDPVTASQPPGPSVVPAALAKPVKDAVLLLRRLLLQPLATDLAAIAAADSAVQIAAAGRFATGADSGWLALPAAPFTPDDDAAAAAAAARALAGTGTSIDAGVDIGVSVGTGTSKGASAAAALSHARFVEAGVCHEAFLSHRRDADKRAERGRAQERAQEAARARADRLSGV